MFAIIKLTDKSNNYIDKVYTEQIKDRNSFTYIDNLNYECKISIYNDGLVLIRQSKDYSLELNLRKNSYAKISTSEGIVKIDVKVVDFIENDDILVMRYIVDDNVREIEVIYRS